MSVDAHIDEDTYETFNRGQTDARRQQHCHVDAFIGNNIDNVDNIDGTIALVRQDQDPRSRCIGIDARAVGRGPWEARAKVIVGSEREESCVDDGCGQDYIPCEYPGIATKQRVTEKERGELLPKF